METFYLILIIALFVLAISDLIVGVSNDAVNFLNSAVGAKAAGMKVIIFVAALGVLAGATFSSGMMEVARKGIFHPEYFYFSEIILLFLAVMVTDVILLDTFNTFGMPTSTTVSIVFELLGAAVAISMVKILTDPNALHLYEYINSGKALAIISGILLSVVIAFTCGMIAQYISRLMFSFDYEKRMRQFGPLWGGVGIMSITYFILIKGAKGASFMSAGLVDLIHEKTILILCVSFIGWALILFILNRVLKIDILKVLVLVGTFALAMAFAGNDLVNFIGVPLAGFNAYELYLESGSTDASSFLMDGLAGKVPTPTLLLLLAGLVMVITLYLSKKARSVVRTSLDLGRQDEGDERFSSFLLSRSLVRNSRYISKYLSRSVSKNTRDAIQRQFDHTPFLKRQMKYGKDAPSFDMIRASVTLVIASILIAVGTNLKLPLSTTYVTFMVFMGTSLADGAWGRESAVYRVSGVLSVVGGWFFTAFSAFTVAFLVALIFYYGGLIAIAIILVLTMFIIYRTHRYHNRQESEVMMLDQDDEPQNLSKSDIIRLSGKQIKTFLNQYGKLVDQSLDGLESEDRSSTNATYKSFRPILKKINHLKTNSNAALDQLSDHELDAGQLYILVLDYLHEMAKEAEGIIETNFNHVENNHKPLLPEQVLELKMLHQKLREHYNLLVEVFSGLEREKLDDFYQLMPLFMSSIRANRKLQIKRIKNHEVGTRNSAVYLGHMSKLRNLSLFSSRIAKVLDDIVLNPTDESEVVPSSIKKELKEMKKEVKSILKSAEEEEETPQDNGESRGDGKSGDSQDNLTVLENKEAVDDENMEGEPEKREDNSGEENTSTDIDE